MTLSLIGGKWKAILLYNLRKGSKRFGELKRLSPGITSATLTTSLKELERAGLITRSVRGGDRLNGVDYDLSERGASLKPVLYAAIRWGQAEQTTYVQGEYGMAAFQQK